MRKRQLPKAVFISIALFYFVSFFCLSQELSQPIHQVTEELDVKVSMRDGIRLSTNIYRPDVSGKFPVMLMRTPYGNGGEGNKDGHFYAQRGYVVVVQDTRGRYESEGLFDAFRYEASDGYTKIRTSVYNISGWFDIVLGGTIENFIRMTDPSIAPDIRVKQKLLIGPWIHNWGKRKVGELDFGEAAAVSGRELQLPWFDSQLKGKNTGIMEEPPVKIFIMGKNVWRYENEWPLARTKYQKYYFHGKGKAITLSGDGFLNVKLPTNNLTDTFIYNPGKPVPTLGDMGPYDQADLEEREDVLVYSTKTLKKDIEVTGPVKVILYAASSAVNTDFTAKLVDVYPDGRAIRLCEGIIRVSYRNPDAPPSNIQPGEVYEYHIDLWATSNVFMKGHQIRVEISSSSFPRFDRNLNTGNFFATDTSMVKARQTIYHSKEYPSCIVLPVIE